MDPPWRLQSLIPLTSVTHAGLAGKFRALLTCCARGVGPLLVGGFHVSLELSLKCRLNDLSLIGDLVLRVEVPFS